MSTCTICGEPLKPEQKVCDVCGTSVPASSAGSGPAPSAPSVPPPSSRPVPPVTAPPPGVASGLSRTCPVCKLQYGPDYEDEFCGCGGELVTTLPAEPSSPVDPADDVSETPEADETVLPETVVAPPPVPVAPTGIVRPAAGTVCLVVYSEAKEPIHYCTINKDVTIIGRSDPVRGDFPDLDLADLFETAISRRISRKHAMVLRSRTAGTYSLRPLGGNTGTQIEKELATALQDYPLTAGTRLILGGVVRLKFEVIS